MIFLTYHRAIPAWKPLALVSALSVCFIAPGVAQANDENPLSRVVVTAARVAQLQTDALPHTTVITAEDIRNSQAFDLPTLLRAEAGIQLTQTGGPGASAGLFMRGAQSSQTLILVDGVPVRVQNGGAALEHILADQIDRIEIVRGNVSAIYGSGAIGGVIQIFTKRGNSEPAFNVSTEVGSRGSFNLNGGVSGQVGDTRYALSLTRFKTDGISANNTKQYPSENPDKDGDRNTSVAASVSQEWSKGHEIGARIYANDGKFSYDNDGYDDGSAGVTTDIYQGHSKQQSLALFSKDRLMPDWLSTVTVSRTETRTQSMGTTAAGDLKYDSRYNSDATLLQWNNELMLSQQWTLAAGIDAAREKADVIGYTQETYSRSTSSVHAGLNGKIDAHQLQMNLRHDQVGGAGSDTTGYLGYGFAVTPALKLLASASTAFHAPTLVQIYDPLYGNPNLKAERARSYEIGAQYAADATLLRITAFDSSTRDQFGYDASYKTININKASNQGVELSAASSLFDTDVRASLTLQDPKDEATGKNLIRRAKTLASLSLSRKYGALRIGTDLQYTGSRLDKDFNTYPATDKNLPSYVLLNLNARYQIDKNLSLFGRVDNLFDRDYQTAYGYNQPSRGVFAGLSWQQ
jgi:vitamin B12 transporter